MLDNERSRHGRRDGRPPGAVELAAVALGHAQGYLDGAEMARVFAWLRPNDLVWNYWVNNYLLGSQPPAFDILYWNTDTTRMPAGLHGDFVERVAGEPVRASPGR